MEIFYPTNSINSTMQKRARIYTVYERILLLLGLLEGNHDEKTVGRVLALDSINGTSQDKGGRGQKEPDQGKISVYKTRATCATAWIPRMWLGGSRMLVPLARTLMVTQEH